jgi:hypothetical protein
MKKLYDHMIRQWQEKEMKSTVTRALLSGLENSYVHNEPKHNANGTRFALLNCCDDAR